MSIVAASQQPDPTLSGAVAAALLSTWLAFVVLSAWIAYRIGVFRRDSIAGRLRLPPKESSGGLLGSFLVGVGLWIVVQSLFLAPQHSTAIPTPGPVPTTLPASDLPKLSPMQYALASTVPGLLGFLAMLVGNIFWRRHGLRRLGLDFHRLRRGVAQGLGAILLLLPTLYVVMVATDAFWKLVQKEHPAEHEVLKLLGESPSRAVTLLFILGATLIAPVFEEMLFRGHLQTLLRRWIPALGNAFLGSTVSPARPRRHSLTPWLAVAVTALLFSLVHPWWMRPPIFFLAFWLGYAYERTGNLWVPITMHAVFNTTSTVLYLLILRAGSAQ